MNNTKKLTLSAVFTAMIVVFQLLSYFIKIGTFPLSLVLIPVVLGGALLGPKYGAYLGGVFGAIVFICCITGMDAGGSIMFGANPIMTAVVCLVKGIAAGLLSALTYKALAKVNDTAASIIAAIVAPVANTGLFILLTWIFFTETLQSWAGGTITLTWLIFGLAGVNFLIELAINVILCPVIKGTVKAIKRI